MLSDELLYQKTVAVLATMHGKERVIAPLLEQGLGLRIGLAMGLDTDRFGTFSHDVARTGSQLDAAKAKIAAAFELAPYARVGIASEGSFGPHPSVPFVPLGLELVLLIDREAGLELAGFDGSPETNFSHAIVRDVGAATEFARRHGFPQQGIIVIGSRDEQPRPDLALVKEINSVDAFETAVHNVISSCGAALVETDMRAHRNPTRMRAIARATSDLVRRFRSRCPACAYPGFDVTERVPGLPCSWCGEPTRVIKTEVLFCRSCGHREERPATANATADPGQCDECNP